MAVVELPRLPPGPRPVAPARPRHHASSASCAGPRRRARPSCCSTAGRPPPTSTGSRLRRARPATTGCWPSTTAATAGASARAAGSGWPTAPTTPPRWSTCSAPDRVIAVGYSMGGPVAQLLWHRHRAAVGGPRALRHDRPVRVGHPRGTGVAERPRRDGPDGAAHAGRRCCSSAEPAAARPPGWSTARSPAGCEARSAATTRACCSRRAPPSAASTPGPGSARSTCPPPWCSPSATAWCRPAASAAWPTSIPGAPVFPVRATTPSA